MKKPLSPEEFKDIYSKVPRLTVEVLLINKNNILLANRSIYPYKGFWHVPGGTVYYKEKVENAVIRVADKELGLKVKAERFVGFIHYPELIDNYGWDWPIGAAYLVSIISGKIKGSSEGKKVKYFNKLPDKIIPSQKEFIINHKLVK